MTKKKKPQGHFGGDAGYKNPPKSGQFKPGVSGNPNGRPKARRVNIIDAIDKELLIQEKVIINGEVQYKSGFELLLRKMKEQALIKNKTQAMKLLLDLAHRMNMHDRFLETASEQEISAILAQYIEKGEE